MTQKITSLVLAASASVALVTGCAGMGHSTSTPVNPVTQYAAEATHASQVAEISFVKGSAALNDSAKQSLNSAIEKARANGAKVSDVRVAAWSDHEYPSDAKVKLSSDQQSLADKRATAIKDYLKGMDVGSIDTYNMAKQSNAFQKAFDTKDVKVKQAFETAGMSTTDTGTAMTAKASHAVVLVITE